MSVFQEDPTEGSGAQLVGIIFGFVLTVGAVISPAPQLVNIIRFRSTEGISFFTVLLANVNCFTQAINVVILNFGKLETCKEDGFYRCAPVITVVLQIVGLWFTYFLNLLFFMIFYQDPKTASSVEEVQESDSKPILSQVATLHPVYYGYGTEPQYQTARDKKIAKSFEYRLTFILFLGFLASLFLGTSLGSFLMAFNGKEHEISLMYARLNGLFASALTFIQWTPQILRTYKQKSAGNFSILMVCIMLPGAFITLAYMIIVAGQSITTWLSYLCSGIQQLVLFSLLLFYEAKNYFSKNKQSSTDSMSNVPVDAPAFVVAALNEQESNIGKRFNSL